MHFDIIGFIFVDSVVIIFCAPYRSISSFKLSFNKYVQWAVHTYEKNGVL